VYRLDRDGTVHLVDGSLIFPNGVVLSPDERHLYVSSSDPANPVWMVYTLDARGAVTEKRVFADATAWIRAGERGNPDGMCMAADGKLFTSGPGGLSVFTPDGRRLGRIETGSTVSNCAFGDDGRTLYMTSSNFVARVRVGVAGLGFPR
jgi:gluconolactonase